MKGAGEKASLVQSLKFGVGIRLFMKKSLLVIVAALTCASVLAQDAAKSPGAAGQLGWQMAIHAYTFRKFSIYECIDKTAELGLKHMSLSGSVSLDGKKSVPTVSLPDGDAEAIKKAVAAKGITLVNIGVVKLPAAEAESRKVFEFAKKMGIDTLVAEPEPDALDTVEKLCKEYNIKVAIHNHPKPSRYWNPDTVLEAVKGRTPLMGSCADTGHWLRSGLNPLECLKKLDGRVICLHFKDLVPDEPKAQEQAVAKKKKKGGIQTHARRALGHRRGQCESPDGRAQAPEFPGRLLRGVRIQLGQLHARDRKVRVVLQRDLRGPGQGPLTAPLADNLKRKALQILRLGYHRDNGMVGGLRVGGHPPQNLPGIEGGGKHRVLEQACINVV